MTEWLDRFTGHRYRLSDEQLRQIRDSLAKELAQQVGAGAAADAANRVAEFWSTTYYERVFPLRFGRESAGDIFAKGAPLVYEDGGSVPAQAAWRTEFLHAMRYPPILPAETQSDLNAPALLIADHHLATAALLNVCLRRLGVDDETLHQARLGALLHELVDLPDIQNALSRHPIALGLANYLKGASDALPDALQPHQSLIEAIHAGDSTRAPDDAAFCIVSLAAQRIKQYVFETSGLPEIRGASQLLDKVVDEMARQVAEQVGSECVLQSVASTLIFLAPEPADWVEQLKRAFYEETLTAFCASAAHEVSLRDFLGDYGACMRDFFAAMDADRYRAELPVWECLPFEARCAFCRRRAAIVLQQVRNNDYLLSCEACQRKHKAGDANERRELGLRPLIDAGILERRNPQQSLKERFRRYFKSLAPKQSLWRQIFSGTLDELVPETDAREAKKQVAFIYGDGSNFGQITRNLDSLGASLQWTRRAELVNRAAIALALSQSMHDALTPKVNLQRMPYEILVVGGDDFSLFTWSRLALRFCQQFLELTDLEYEKGNQQECIVGETPICYGVGCLISDEKAPVSRVVPFTESYLLKYAKRGVKAHERGTIAFLFTTNADQIPSDYKAHLLRNYRREGRPSKGQTQPVPIYLTMQPLTAPELDAFLQCATAIQSDLGSLQRLAEPFVRQPIEAALLHFVYQRARAEKSSDANAFFERILKLSATNRAGAPVSLFPAQTLHRITPESDQRTQALFAPILDLLEMVKSLR